jgi:hypothetical protein
MVNPITSLFEVFRYEPRGGGLRFDPYKVDRLPQGLRGAVLAAWRERVKMDFFQRNVPSEDLRALGAAT